MDSDSSDQTSARESHDDSVTKPSPRNADSKFPQPTPPPESGTFGISAFSRLTSGLSFRSTSSPAGDAANEAPSGIENGGLLGSFAKGIFDTSRNAVKAVQLKARHAVSQNKRRYQEGGFDLDMAYITENVIAMGFPAGDLSSGILGFLEGFYRNHMEEVIKFFETHHKGKYKVYNLCSERLYDASRFQGKVACFPFDDHNCPPIHMVMSFCQSAHSWLKEDIQNVVVVHCKAGMGRTGLMICSFLLFLKFFPTAEEAIEYFNQKRCIDGKALILPSQIRYVKYFERVITRFNGEIPSARRCMLRGFRFLKCPYWIRPSITISNHSGVLFSTRKHPKTKNLMPEDFWISAPKKGITVFAVPGEPGLTEVAGDFKIHFHDHLGDFYCWLNTITTENRTTLDGSEFDGFDKRKIPSPGFQVEIVMIDFDSTLRTKPKVDSATKRSDGSGSSDCRPLPSSGIACHSNPSEVENEDSLFSDSEGEEIEASRCGQAQATSKLGHAQPGNKSDKTREEIKVITSRAEQLSLSSQQHSQVNSSKEENVGGIQNPTPGNLSNQDSTGAYDIKAIAADASVFSFGDEEDFESD